MIIPSSIPTTYLVLIIGGILLIALFIYMIRLIWSLTDQRDNLQRRVNTAYNIAVAGLDDRRHQDLLHWCCDEKVLLDRLLGQYNSNRTALHAKQHELDLWIRYGKLQNINDREELRNEIMKMEPAGKEEVNMEGCLSKYVYQKGTDATPAE